jgi:alkaline phosphatase
MLPVATKTALNILSKNRKGFFMMIEGSQIDWAGHANNTTYTVEDMLDFDKTIGEVLEFAAADGKTLVIVTADHETGGMAVSGGDLKTGTVKGAFTSTGHTAVMVPIFAWGPGAQEFMGIMENTDVYSKMRKLLLGK